MSFALDGYDTPLTSDGKGKKTQAYRNRIIGGGGEEVLNYFTALTNKGHYQKFFRHIDRGLKKILTPADINFLHDLLDRFLVPNTQRRDGWMRLSPSYLAADWTPRQQRYRLAKLHDHGIVDVCRERGNSFRWVKINVAVIAELVGPSDDIKTKSGGRICNTTADSRQSSADSDPRTILTPHCRSESYQKTIGEPSVAARPAGDPGGGEDCRCAVEESSVQDQIPDKSAPYRADSTSATTAPPQSVRREADCTTSEHPERRHSAWDDPGPSGWDEEDSTTARILARLRREEQEELGSTTQRVSAAPDPEAKEEGFVDAPGRALEYQKSERQENLPVIDFPSSPLDRREKVKTEPVDAEFARLLRKYAESRSWCPPPTYAACAQNFAILRRRHGEGEVRRVLTEYIRLEVSRPRIVTGKEFKRHWDWIVGVVARLNGTAAVADLPPVLLTEAEKEEVKRICQNVGYHAWPKGANTKLAPVVLQSYGNYNQFWKRFRAAGKLLPDSLRFEYSFLLQHLRSPEDYLPKWFKEQHQKVRQWREWSGDVAILIWKEEHKDFRHFVLRLLSKNHLRTDALEQILKESPGGK